MNTGKVLHVEVAPLQSGQRERTVTISTGTNGSAATKTVEVGSLQKLMRLLSEPNVKLMTMIKTVRPKSVAELARLSGRPKASLTQTLRRLERFGLIAFRQSSGRRKAPEVVCDQVTLDVMISDAPAIERIDGKAA